MNLLETTAYHEAGHAVAIYCAGFTLQDIDIVPVRTERGDLILGSAYMDSGYVDDTASEVEIVEKVRKVIVCYLGGGIAERRHTHRYSNFSHADLQMVNAILKQDIKKEHRKEFLKKYCHDAARQIIDDYWQAVVSLSTALIEQKKISADEIKKIIESALVDNSKIPPN